MAKTKTEFIGEKDGVKIYFAQYLEPETIVEALKEIAKLHAKKKYWLVYQPANHAEIKKSFEKLIKALNMAHRGIVTDVASFGDLGDLKPSPKELAVTAGGPKITYVGGELVNAANFVKRNTEDGTIVLVCGGIEAKVISDGLMSA